MVLFTSIKARIHIHKQSPSLNNKHLRYSACLVFLTSGGCGLDFKIGHVLWPLLLFHYVRQLHPGVKKNTEYVWDVCTNENSEGLMKLSQILEKTLVGRLWDDAGPVSLFFDLDVGLVAGWIDEKGDRRVARLTHKATLRLAWCSCRGDIFIRFGSWWRSAWRLHGTF